MLHAACRAEVAARLRTFYSPDEYRQHIWDISKWLTSKDSTFGLFLSGNKGNGKTTIVKALQSLYCYLHSDETLSTECDMYNLPRKGFRMITAKELVQLAKAYNNPTKDNSKAVDDYRLARDIEILCIDDLGAEPHESMIYGDIVTAVTDIILYRYQEQYCTIATSNLSADEIAGYYDERFADRMREMCHIINFGNEPSFRTESYKR